MTSEESIKQGRCPNCGGAMQQWTEAEIAEAKADIGMATDDEFFACCKRCEGKYLPAANSANLQSIWPDLFLARGKL